MRCADESINTHIMHWAAKWFMIDSCYTTMWYSRHTQTPARLLQCFDKLRVYYCSWWLKTFLNGSSVTKLIIRWDDDSNGGGGGNSSVFNGIDQLSCVYCYQIWHVHVFAYAWIRFVFVVVVDCVLHLWSVKWPNLIRRWRKKALYLIGLWNINVDIFFSPFFFDIFFLCCLFLFFWICINLFVSFFRWKENEREREKKPMRFAENKKLPKPNNKITLQNF